MENKPERQHLALKKFDFGLLRAGRIVPIFWRATMVGKLIGIGYNRLNWRYKRVQRGMKLSSQKILN